MARIDISETTRQVHRVIITILLVMMFLVVFLGTIRLGWILIEEILKGPKLMFRVDDLIRIFGLFLVVLIGVELIETIHGYLAEDRVRVEFVMTVTLTAIARKIITLDYTKVSGLSLVGLAAIVLALGAGYFFLRTRIDKPFPAKAPVEPEADRVDSSE